MNARRRLLAALLGVLLGTVSAFGAPETAPGDRFREGNRLYQDGKFAEAADAYSRILEAGVTAPELEYNLGNAYLKSNRLGMAVLHYRRALRLDPGYENASENLSYARSLTQDVKPDEGASQRLAWIGRLRLGPAAAGALLFAAVTACFLVAALRLRLWRSHAGATVLQGAFAGLALLAAAALLFEWNDLHGRNEGVVVAGEAEVRSGPGEGYTVSFRLHDGTEVELLREREGWRELRVSEKLQGWVLEKNVSVI